MRRSRARLERLERDAAPEPIGTIVVELIDIEDVPIGEDGRPVDVFEVTVVDVDVQGDP